MILEGIIDEISDINMLILLYLNGLSVHFVFGPSCKQEETDTNTLNDMAKDLNLTNCNLIT